MADRESLTGAPERVENMPHLRWWHLALLRVLDEQSGFTAGKIGRAVWTNFTPREAASTASPHLKRLREWGLATLLDDGRPMIWLRTPAGTARIVAGSEEGDS